MDPSAYVARQGLKSIALGDGAMMKRRLARVVSGLYLIEGELPEVFSKDGLDSGELADAIISGNLKIRMFGRPRVEEDSSDSIQILMMHDGEGTRICVLGDYGARRDLNSHEASAAVK